MNIVTAQVGIDVSKLELVVSVNQGKAFVVSNDASGFEKLVELLPARSEVHLEASGGYERAVGRFLEGAGFTVRKHNALKARRLAQGLGVRAKTDPVDARGLSASAHLLPSATPKSTEREQLADLSRLISAIQESASSFRRRLAVPALDKQAAEEIAELVKALEARIVDLERKFALRVRASALAGKYELILSVPGVGPKTARVCLGELPENLPEQRPEQISSYAGLAPINDESGKRQGKARLGHGNARLKASLYMPALGAVQTQRWAKDLYARLRARGRAHQLAIVAVMRRLLLRIVAVLKRGSPWQAEPQRA